MNDVEVVERLEAMAGATAMIWMYTASLQELTLRLMRRDEEGNVHVLCNACESLAGPTQWLDANLSLRRASDGLWELADAKVGFLVRCRLVRTEENVEPVYSG